MVNVLALPIYHPKLMNDRRPPPWSIIAVVTFSSSAYGSIVGMDEEELQILRDLAADTVPRHSRRFRRKARMNSLRRVALERETR